MRLNVHIKEQYKKDNYAGTEHKTIAQFSGVAIRLQLFLVRSFYITLTWKRYNK